MLDATAFFSYELPTGAFRPGDTVTARTTASAPVSRASTHSKSTVADCPATRVTMGDGRERKRGPTSCALTTVGREATRPAELTATRR